METMEKSGELMTREGQDKEESTLEALRKKESNLRDKLEDYFADDSHFEELVREIKRLIEIANTKYREGIDKAKALETALIVLGKIIEETQRGKTGRECMETIGKRQQAEKETGESEKHMPEMAQNEQERKEEQKAA